LKALLEAESIDVVRGGRRVIENVSVAVQSGEALAVVGPNAAGKSTLVRALAGLLPVTAGRVRLLGRPLDQIGRGQRARQIALVTAEDEGPTTLRVGDRVALGRYPHVGPLKPLRGEDVAAIEAAIDQTGIAHLADRSLGTLSAGERQRATLARALAQEPRLLLLDEPSAHLDVGHELALFDVLDEVRRRGVGVLVVVHDLQRAAQWAERMILLHEGRIRRSGIPADVLKSEECRDAFAVEIQGHAVADVDYELYSFRTGPDAHT
jgi:iron complex transport system ATP-binding protein